MIDASTNSSSKLPQKADIPLSASEGWSADDAVDNKQPRFLWLKRLPVLLLLAVLAALVFEVVICNHRAVFFNSDRYPKRVIELPFNESQGRNAVVLSPQHNSFTLGGLDLPLNSLYIKTHGDRVFVEGSIFLSDDARSKNLVPGNNFVVCLGSDENATDVFVFSNGNVHSLAFELTNLHSIVAIEEIVLNQRPAFHFSTLRFALTAAFLMLVVAIFKLRLYEKRIDLRSRAYKLGTGGALAFCLLLSWSCFHYINPQLTNPIFFQYFEEGQIYQSTPNHTLFLDFPRTPQELGNHDVYIQQMDAWLKGQLNLDLPIDPKLRAIPDPYDLSLRTTAGIKAYNDRQFYDGKYYSYYGPAPILILYLPLYLITGEVPSPSLAIYIVTLWYIASIFFLCHVVVKTLGLRPNALIFFTGEVALITGSMTLFNLIGQQFYYIAMPMSMTFISCGFACLLLAYNKPNTMLSHVLLVLAGICVVMTVLTRPQMLLMALALMMPFMVLRLKETCFASEVVKQGKTRAKLRVFVWEHLYLMVPVVIGAIGTMLYNYARFDNVFEFGQQYTLSVEDSRYKLVRLSLSSLSHVLYFSFLQPYEYLKGFPYFVAPYKIFSDYGNYHFFEITLGLFSIPLTYVLVLIYPCLRQTSQGMSQSSNNAGNNAGQIRSALLRTLGVCGVLVIGFSFLIGYVEFHYAANAARYTSQLLYGWCVMAFILLCVFAQYQDSGRAKLLYFIALCLIAKTIIVGYFIAFSHLDKLGYDFFPEYLIELRRFFSPLLG